MKFTMHVEMDVRDEAEAKGHAEGLGIWMGMYEEKCDDPPVRLGKMTVTDAAGKEIYSEGREIGS